MADQMTGAENVSKIMDHLVARKTKEVPRKQKERKKKKKTTMMG